MCSKPKIHRLKVWPLYFDDIDCENKGFELRINDRGFEIGDYLVLLEYQPANDEYTGRVAVRTVDYVLDNHPGLVDGYVVMSISRLYGEMDECLICGCTENDCHQCIEETGQACSWADDDHTICSACLFSDEGKEVTNV